MVATKPVRAPSRVAAAILLCVLMLVPALPLGAGQPPIVPETPTTPQVDIAVRQGSAWFYQGSASTPRPEQGSPFVDNRTDTTRLTVPIRNNGPVDREGVPVYFYFQKEQAQYADCVIVPRVRAATDAGPGIANATWVFDSRPFHGGGYNITVWAWVSRSTVQDAAGYTIPSCDPTKNGYTDTSTDVPGNNRIQAYFVKEHKLDLVITEFRWCNGTASSSTCDVVEPGENVTQEPEDVGVSGTPPTNTPPANTYFEARVENHGTWHNMSDYGADPSGDAHWGYALDMRLRGPYVGEAILTPTDVSGVGWKRSATWNLTGKAGVYNLTANIDPLGRLRQAVVSNDVAQKDFEVAYRELTGNFTAEDLRTDPSEPYPYDGAFDIVGNVTFRNDGPAHVPGEVNYRVYIEDTSRPYNQSNFVKYGVFNTMSNFSEHVVEFTFSVSTTPGSRFIEPGRHRIVAEIDSIDGDPGSTGFGTEWNRTFELDETNNNFTIDIYIEDGEEPDVLAAKITNGSVNNAPIGHTRPHEPFNVHANVTDNDASLLDVYANFTLDLEDEPDVWRVYKMSKQLDGDRYGARVSNFTFHDKENMSVENWTLRIEANDSFNNRVVGLPQTLQLYRWDIHNASHDYVLLRPANGTEFGWNNEPVEVRVLVLDNATGIGDQELNATNLALNLTTPPDENGVATTHTYPTWSAKTSCSGDTSGLNNINNAIGEQEINCEDYSQFAMSLDVSEELDGARPGTWNVSVTIRDVAGLARRINSTFEVVDRAPEILDHFVSTNVSDPGGTLRLVGNFSDDFAVKSAHVNFTRVTDKLVLNYTLTNLTIGAMEDGRAYYNYDTNLSLGRGASLGVAGTFNLTFEVVDFNGNWNTVAAGNFTLNDTDAPSFTAVGVAPPLQELDANVTFYARVSDQSNVTVELQVLRGSEEVFPKVLIPQANASADGNFTHTFNLSREGTYTWVAQAFDSRGLPTGAARTGPLTVRANLGPRIEVRSPSAVVDFERFGSATPRIDLLVYDSDGVDAQTVQMNVSGLPVVPDVLPGPAGVNGFILSYTVPATKKFSHRDVVEVNVTATDNSTARLTGHLNFSFTVDDVPPVARVVSINPSHRDQPSHPLNVSLQTRFTLAAEDDDGLPTKAASIRYRIIGGGNNAAETVYTGPFKITDVPGIYTGPRIYQVQFWAEDSVGNFDRSYNVTTIFVDDTPPALYQFFPQGRYINATFVDDRAGVDRAVAWHRINDDPYRPSPLTQDGDVWSLVLPEAKKGDVVSYYLQVWDKLENTDTFGNASAPYARFDVSNHAPELRITGPSAGARVSRGMDLTWEASDQDGDDLVFTVYYRAPGKTNFVEMARIENTAARRFTVDTTKLADGEYTFRVAAGDGGFVELAEVRVTLLNRAGAIGAVTPPPDRILPGESILIKAEVTKAQATVEARLYREGRLVDAYPMNDEGRDGDEVANDGYYSVRVAIDAAGDYKVDIYSQYREDGEQKESLVSGAATFSAGFTPGYVLSKYATLLVLIGLLAVAAIGAAVFVVTRRR